MYLYLIPQLEPRQALYIHCSLSIQGATSSRGWWEFHSVRCNALVLPQLVRAALKDGAILPADFPLCNWTLAIYRGYNRSVVAFWRSFHSVCEVCAVSTAVECHQKVPGSIPGLVEGWTLGDLLSSHRPRTGTLNLWYSLLKWFLQRIKRTRTFLEKSRYHFWSSPVLWRGSYGRVCPLDVNMLPSVNKVYFTLLQRQIPQLQSGEIWKKIT